MQPLRDIIFEIMQTQLPHNDYPFLTSGNPKNRKVWFEKIFPFFEKHEIRFILLFSIFFLATIILLSLFGLIPSEFQENTNQKNLLDTVKNAAIAPLQGGNNSLDSQITSIKPANSKNEATKNYSFEYPLRIVIPSVGVDGAVKNPASNNIDVLDNALTLGAVRYPGSGVPGSGNMFIFGHSTAFKIVQNKAFKIFNTIQNSKVGDEVQIFGDKNVYIYKVTSVKEVNKDDTLVNFNTEGPATLVLSTCDSFGAKTDRFVVQAIFERVVPISR